jgi:hypothetical protein
MVRNFGSAAKQRAKSSATGKAKAKAINNGIIQRHSPPLLFSSLETKRSQSNLTSRTWVLLFFIFVVALCSHLRDDLVPLFPDLEHRFLPLARLGRGGPSVGGEACALFLVP